MTAIDSEALRGSWGLAQTVSIEVTILELIIQVILETLVEHMRGSPASCSNLSRLRYRGSDTLVFELIHVFQIIQVIHRHNLTMATLSSERGLTQLSHRRCTSILTSQHVLKVVKHLVFGHTATAISANIY